MLESERRVRVIGFGEWNLLRYLKYDRRSAKMAGSPRPRLLYFILPAASASAGRSITELGNIRINFYSNELK